MSTSLQLFVVGLLLAWSGWRLGRQLFPVFTRDVQNRLAQRVTRAGWARLGSWLQSGESGAGCGSGCDACGNCTTPAAEPEQSVKLVGRLGKDEGHPE